MEKIKKSLKSLRFKLFLTLSIVVVIIIGVLIILNNIILETYYEHNRRNTLKMTYEQINNYYNMSISTSSLREELGRISVNNNFDILIVNGDDNIYYSGKDVFSSLSQMSKWANIYDEQFQKNLQAERKILINKVDDDINNTKYLFMSSKLDNGYMLYTRTPISFIHQSIQISNRFLFSIAGILVILAGIIVSFVSRKFTSPIVELNKIATKMSNLDFSDKYKITDVDNEIDNLGKSINIMSDKLEKTIKQLRATNLELEKDIEEKSQIEEMRKSFISDVSHELKTPIALIQGYSEGLLENVNTDEESRKFYAEVILDETNKMDKLVKQLLELMKLEYGKREFNNEVFNIVELEKEVLRKSTVMLEEKGMQVLFNEKEEINVIADSFYIEQVITNYVTNAIKYSKEINGEKIIKIENKVDEKNKKVRIKIFNTGENITEEEQTRIWNRFYRGDEARNREDGSTGIGLSIVKAIMGNYNQKYGLVNKLDGVEFYFELNIE